MKRIVTAGSICLATGLLAPTISADQRNQASGTRNFSVIIELAGADESDRATEKELKESGTKMVPASPSANSRDPLQIAPKDTETQKPEPVVVEEKTPQPVPEEAAPAKVAPADPETKSASDNQGSAAPAAASDAAAPSDPKPAPVASDEDQDQLFKPYARLDTGYALMGSPGGNGRNGTHQSTDVQDTGLFGVGIGMKVDDQVRLEGTLTYFSPFDVDGRDGAGNNFSTELESISAMLSILYDIEQVHDLTGTDVFTPYVGGGVGIAMMDTDSLTTSGAASEPGTEVYNLSYSLQAGIGAKITDTLTLDFGYKFINMGQFEQDGGVSNGANSATTKFDDLLVHQFKAGIRYQF